MRLKPFFILAGMLLAATPAAARNNIYTICGKIVGNVCIVTGNGGGRVDDFTQAANEIVARGMRVEVRGACYSACIQTFVANLKDRACTTASGSFITHRGMVTLEKNYIDGLPVVSGDEKFYSAAQAVQAGLIAPCSGSERLTVAYTGPPPFKKLSNGSINIQGCDTAGKLYKYHCK